MLPSLGLLSHGTAVQCDHLRCSYLCMRKVPVHNVFSMSLAAAGTGWWLRSLRIHSACALRTCPKKPKVEQVPLLCLIHPCQLICQLNGGTDLVLQHALMQCVPDCLQWLPEPVPLGARIGRGGSVAARRCAPSSTPCWPCTSPMSCSSRDSSPR